MEGGKTQNMVEWCFRATTNTQVCKKKKTWVDKSQLTTRKQPKQERVVN